MNKNLFLGDEAIAQAAIDAGISAVYAYPGTPSTEITEYIQSSVEGKAGNIYCRWATNEKTAMEAALGMSFVGKRALVCMKHVGMNVAADAFINSAMTGVNGGVVVVAADDPSMHSSQNEQDSRFYGYFSMVPIVEPATQQEAYDIVRMAFDLSEKHKEPILLRIPTRLAHSRSGVETREARSQNTIKLPEQKGEFILLPANARRKYKLLLAKEQEFVADSENSEFNKLIEGKDKSLGIVACGIAYNYLMENFKDECPYSVLKVSQYPLPRKQLERLVDSTDAIIVLEDGMPIIEKKLKGLLGRGLTVKGRLDGTLPRDGELNPDIVGRAFGLECKSVYEMPEFVEQRPPALCQGCGHRDMYEALNAVAAMYTDSKVFSDIGCYTLGALPPYRAIDSCVDMGASITMAKGASDGGLFPAFAVIGDSTFTHSGMTGLLDCVNSKSNVVIVISDNETTAMTGGQQSQGTGKIEAICEAIGVEKEHIRTLVPLKKNFDEMVEVIKQEVEYNGVSVIVPRRECIQTLARKNRQKQKSN